MDQSLKNTNDSGKRNPKTVAGYLATALDMEDQINTSIYKDYLDEKNWPKNLKPEIFQNIKQYLNTLIEDTEKHSKIISELIEKIGKDEQSK